MVQSTIKLTLKPGAFEDVNRILIDEVEEMKSFVALNDVSVTKVDDTTLVVVATYKHEVGLWEPVDLEPCAIPISNSLCTPLAASWTARPAFIDAIQLCLPPPTSMWWQARGQP